jgi:hypothetical protein
MSPRSAINISTGVTELTTAPPIGTKAMEMAIKAFKIMRDKPIRELSGDVDRGSTALL